MKNYKILPVLLLLVVGIGKLPAVADSIESILLPKDEICVVPFSVDSSNSRRIFANVIWGVSIISIEADGVKIVPERTTVDFMANPSAEIQVSASTFIYPFLGNSLLCGVNENLEKVESYVRYKWPEEFNELKIVYRERYPDSTTGKIRNVTVVSIRTLYKRNSPR